MTVTLRPRRHGPSAPGEKCDGCERQIPRFVSEYEPFRILRLDEYRAEDGDTTTWRFCPDCGAEAVSFLKDSIAFPDPADQPDVDLTPPPLKGSPCGFCGDEIEGVARGVSYAAGVGAKAAGYVCDGCAVVVQNFLEMVPETPSDGDAYFPPALIEAEEIAEPGTDEPGRMQCALDVIGDIALDGPQFRFRALAPPTDYAPGRYVEGEATAERIESPSRENNDVNRLRATVNDWDGYIYEDEFNSIRIEWPASGARGGTARPTVKTSPEGYNSEYYNDLGNLIEIDTDLEVPEAPPENQDSTSDPDEPASSGEASTADPTDQRDDYVAPDRTAAEQMRRLPEERVKAIFAPVLDRRDGFEAEPDRLVLNLSVDWNVGLTGYVATHVEGLDQDEARVAYPDSDEVEVDQFHKAGQMDGTTLEVMLGTEPITPDSLITRLYEAFLFAAEKREEAHPFPPITLDGVLGAEGLEASDVSEDPTEAAEEPWEQPFPPEHQVSVGDVSPERAVERLEGLELDNPLSMLACAADPRECAKATVTTETHPRGDHPTAKNHQIAAWQSVRVGVTVNPPLGSQYEGKDAEWRAMKVWHSECAPSAEEFRDEYSLGEQSFAGFYVKGTVETGEPQTYTEAGKEYDYQPLLLGDPEILHHQIRERE